MSDSKGKENLHPRAELSGHSRRNVVMFEQVAEDITEKAKGTTSIERLPKPTANLINLNLMGQGLKKIKGTDEYTDNHSTYQAFSIPVRHAN
jgi:hypothetical protein